MSQTSSVLSEHFIQDPSTIPPYPQTTQNSLQNANIFSRIFFHWIHPLIRLGNKYYLEQYCLDDLREQDKSENQYQVFAQAFNYYKTRSKQPLIRTLIHQFKKQIIVSYTFSFFYSCLEMCTPILIRVVIDYVSDQKHDLDYGIILLLLIMLSRILNCLTECHSAFNFNILGYNFTNAISIALFKKSLNISLLNQQQYNSGILINMLQVDTQKLQVLCYYVSTMTFLPLQIIFALYLMYDAIGISFLFGVGIMFFMGFVNYIIGRFSYVNQRQLMIAKDKRMNISSEIFNSIKVIKANAWEEHFYDKLEVKREKELELISKKFILGTLAIFTLWITPMLIINSTFAGYILLDNVITPQKAFTIISLFYILQEPIRSIPMVINYLIEAYISIKRIEKYFQFEEVKKDDIIFKQKNKDFAIRIINGYFFWQKQGHNLYEMEDSEEDQNNENTIENNIQKKYSNSNQSEDDEDDLQNTQASKNKNNKNYYTLININMQIPKGKLVAIIGDVGSGKSSVLYSILGEMRYDKCCGFSPQIYVDGKISFVSQKSWITNATVRDNIIFGNQFSEQKYKNVIFQTCLIKDFANFQQGDKTLIGEKGANLSGGQKARITLARALYNDTEILLLDDILSAVDAHVAKSIINNCLKIKDSQNKTILLSTHALYYMKYMDYIYFMENGQIKQQGIYEEMCKSQCFQQIFDKCMKTKINDFKIIQMKIQEDEFQQINFSSFQKQKNKQNGIIILEDRKKGSIQFSLIRKFIKFYGGFLFIILIFFSMLIWQILKNFSNIWIAIWTKNNQEDKNIYYLTIFSLISLSYGIFAIFRVIITFYCSINASRIIHKRMITSLIFAPLNEFFERVPFGRILNRLSKDMQVVDQDLAFVLGSFLVAFFSFIGDAILCIFASSYWVIIPTVLFIVSCKLLQGYYMRAQREIVRMETISRSPIVSFFAETLQGLSIIRAFVQKERFQKQHCNNIDDNKKNQLAFIAMEAWFKQNLTFMSLFVNTTAISFCLFSPNPDPSMTGLLLTFAFSIDQQIQNLIMTYSSFEKKIVSFERCYSYTRITPEEGQLQYLKDRENLRVQRNLLKNYKDDPLLLWPQQGSIEFQDFYLKYRKNLTYVLKGINVIINPGEKIGIVGRTGAGKSTITLALLRILEAFKGKIIIDKIDISKIRLDELRSKITIIMQDSSLFDGSLRHNIDPQSLYSDSDIIRTLNQCQLNHLIKNDSLDAPINEGGDNLSMGEKQLICIARALLKRSKIVLIDEATANIDIQTDFLIQKVIQKVFKDCTVLTIAHRVNTIINCNRILFLNKGQVQEFDTPQNLLNDKKSAFYSLYQEYAKENKI
ncbi:hypothetical protein IMG5_169310 [Ichthyophthirius multifiliis]|uniref:ABC transporter family protein n=1 Tax=Ichthyophthirius multifiliis TaxID=5932 RepID=G0R1A1_ICHMU|nr:hypothetical protein IMG5_169310 [Ichthyophthirius multifiliis]EGR28734.1 hypothetical protein IMG5_169310 [Ichthyophthirius multifiliis]|eukprot:XP_004029970.1 hypothetical protein IMG5_169310 [Ichthyophthirius multifiliis]